jgi:hypothetical protein
MASSTALIELTELSLAGEVVTRESKSANVQEISSNDELKRRVSNFAGPGITLEPTVEEAQRWNKPTINMYR